MIGKQSPDIEALLAAKKAVWELQFFNLKKIHHDTCKEVLGILSQVYDDHMKTAKVNNG